MSRTIHCTPDGNSTIPVTIDGRVVKAVDGRDLPLFGSKARAHLQFFATLAAVALRAPSGGPTVAEVRAAPGWDGLQDDVTAAARVRGLLGNRVKQTAQRFWFAGDVAVSFATDRTALSDWVWPPQPSLPPSSPLDLVQSAALLFRGEKVNRKQADALARQWGCERKLPLRWLVEELGSTARTREERAVIASALGAHPDADDGALRGPFVRLHRVRADGTVYAYRVLHSARELLTAGRGVSSPERFLEDLLYFEESGGNETAVAAKAVRRDLLARVNPVAVTVLEGEAPGCPCRARHQRRGGGAAHPGQDARGNRPRTAVRSWPRRWLRGP